MHLGEGFTNHFLGQARTFTALAGYAGGLADFAIAAATFVDRFADLPVGDASAEAYIHKLEPSLVVTQLRRILMLTRMIVKVVSENLVPERCLADERFGPRPVTCHEMLQRFFNTAEKPLKTVQIRGV